MTDQPPGWPACEDDDVTDPDALSDGDRAAAVARIRDRYPKPLLPRPLATAAICVVAALGVGWLVWSGVVYARPAVSGQAAGFRIVDDSSVAVTITVDRPDPSLPVQCLVIVQAADFERVGELEVEVAATNERLVDTTVTVTTLRRGTSASVKGCHLIG